MGEDGAGSSRPPRRSEVETEDGTRIESGVAETVDASYVRVSRAPTDRAPAIPPPVVPGDDRYALVEELGRGGMGRVVLAEDRLLGRRVALKSRLGAPNERALLRFREEACATAQLEHPNIVPVYDLDQDPEGQPRFSMRAVAGRSLAELVRALRDGDPEVSQAFGSAQLLLVFTKVCDAVAYAHSRGVIHRDLKPDNVMVGQFGEVFVMDWGLARVGEVDLGEGAGAISISASLSGDRSISSVRDSGARLTMDGSLLGTPGYMAPEQARGQTSAIDRRSDVYALGAILYELLTLEPAVEGMTVPGVLVATLVGQIIPPRRRAPGRRISEELEAIVLRALALEPADRYQSAIDLRQAVSEALEGSREAARRREASQEKLALARTLLERSRALARDLSAERGALDARLAETPLTQEYLQDRIEVFRAQGDLDAREAEARRAFWDAYGALLGATQDDPSFEDARVALVDLLLDRAGEARAVGDASTAQDLETMARQHDAARVAAVLDAPATLSVTTSPAGARARVARFEPQGPLLVEVPVGELEPTPSSTRLPPGSYVLDVEHPERPAVRATVCLEAGEERALDLFLPPEGAILDGFVYVPGGRYLVGGDPLAPGAEPRRTVELEPFAIGRRPVTMGEYAEFLNALRAEDPELAVAHAPRIGSAVYWSPEEDGVYRAPFTDPDGDVIGPQLPLFMMHLEGADAYARWLSARLGGRVRLPTSDEWHVAGSGGDGRAYPWGVGFDPALCWMAESPNANRGPVPVGSHPRDRSPLGMMDVVGNVREWASDARTAEPIMRSGAWQASREQCRLGRRSVSAHGGAYVTLGVRLVQQLSTSNE